MAREELQLEATRFTSYSALVREILALLESTDYKLAIIIPNVPSLKERLDNEMEGVKTLGRVKVRQV